MKVLHEDEHARAQWVSTDITRQNEIAQVLRLARPDVPPAGPRTRVPYLSEPWYCCAEPNPDEVMLV